MWFLWGTIISLSLNQKLCFLIYGEWLANEVMKGAVDFVVGEKAINVIKYADVIVLLVNKEETLQEVMNILVERGRKYVMEIK